MNCLRRLPCLGNSGFSPLKEASAPSGILNYEVSIRTKSGKPTSTVRVTHEVYGQHTIKWHDTIVCQMKQGKVSLPPGSCNIYGFPIAWIEGMDESKTKPLEGNEYKCICELIVALARKKNCPFMTTPDGAGALAIHGILVGNQMPALKLGLRVIRTLPECLLHVHTEPVFTDENSFHIVAVNRHEKLFIEMVNIACARLSKDELRSIFRSQARGIFFSDLPMRHYGGTCVAYAICFGLKDAVMHILKKPELDGIVDLNDTDNACTITGFLPIHAAAANGLRGMVDFLSDLPNHPELELKRAKSYLTRPAQLRDLTGLSPLQLAVKLGDRLMFMHILQRQTNILWKWGPITQYMIDLDGVDSAGAQKGEDVMELVGQMNAVVETKELLLDSVMNGFVYSLFEYKWKRYSGKLHWLLLCFDLLYVVPLTILCFEVKTDVKQSSKMMWLPELVLFTGGLSLMPDLITFPFWWDAHGWWRFMGPRWRMKLFAEMLEWIAGLGIYLKFTSVFLAVIACTMLLLPGPINDVFRPNGTSRRQMLHNGGKAVESHLLFDPCHKVAFIPHDPTAAESLGDEIWLLLGFSVFLQMYFVMNTFMMPFKKLGILMLTVNRMLQEDITTFMTPFTLIMLAFYAIMYTVYPRAGEMTLPQANAFNDWASGLESLVKLAFLGEPIDVFITAEAFGALSLRQGINYTVFIVFYVFYILLGMVLLLNLLIAMLSNTFSQVQAQADLEWRLERVRRILRLELMAVRPFYTIDDIRIGDKQGDKYFIPFRGVQPNQEGIEVQGGADMYAAINKFDWKIRPPQFEDLEEDDDDLGSSTQSTPRPSTPRQNLPLPPAAAPPPRSEVEYAKLVPPEILDPAPLPCPALPSSTSPPTSSLLERRMVDRPLETLQSTTDQSYEPPQTASAMPATLSERERAYRTCVVTKSASFGTKSANPNLRKVNSLDKSNLVARPGKRPPASSRSAAR
ncbi:hypothetical protein AB1Y20_005058 [Prymnesium parvum]|uniref:Ion transport domain-containing protein n=1 Tax=Prymnesium parvum TaxID=97485 RepID=A0AB34J363_PRYPA